jgi:hypothetical protein
MKKIEVAQKKSVGGVPVFKMEMRQDIRIEGGVYDDIVQHLRIAYRPRSTFCPSLKQVECWDDVYFAGEVGSAVSHLDAEMEVERLETNRLKRYDLI